jgi:hypothetical protein
MEQRTAAFNAIRELGFHRRRYGHDQRLAISCDRRTGHRCSCLLRAHPQRGFMAGFRVEPAASSWLPHRPVRAQLWHTVPQAPQARSLLHR